MVRKGRQSRDFVAQTALGWMYAEGHGVTQDLAHAVALFQRVQIKGTPSDSTFWTMYLKGQGLPQDFVQASNCFGKAADQGDARAQTALGWMYADGQEGMPQHSAQAGHWFGKAAEQGDAYAQANLSWLYANGQGVVQDDTLALMWSTLAFAHAEDDATRKLAASIRDAVAAEMTPDQVAEAKRMAGDRFRK